MKFAYAKVEIDLSEPALARAAADSLQADNPPSREGFCAAYAEGSRCVIVAKYPRVGALLSTLDDAIVCLRSIVGGRDEREVQA